MRISLSEVAYTFWHLNDQGCIWLCVLMQYSEFNSVYWLQWSNCSSCLVQFWLSVSWLGFERMIDSVVLEIDEVSVIDWFRNWWLGFIYVKNWWLGFSDWLMRLYLMVVVQRWLILSFNVIDGSSLTIWWNVACILCWCVPGVSSLKIYETWSLEKEWTW